MDIEQIAMVCYEVNRAYCKALGDDSQKPWKETEEEIKRSARDGVKFLIESPRLGPESSHENWLRFKEQEGWKHGKEKDEVKKTHPCFVPFDQLPKEQKAKDFIFHAIVHNLKDKPQIIS